MSFAHLRFKKSRENRDDIVYSVLSPDFSDNGEWQEIAEVAISRTQSTHTFSPRNCWTNEKIIPPYIYGLSEEERQKILASQFIGYGFGAWTGRILSQVRRMQVTGNFPDEIP
jgi:hypothetical protein